MFFLNDKAKLERLINLLKKRTNELEMKVWATYFRDILKHKSSISDYEQRLTKIYKADVNLDALYQKREHFCWESLLPLSFIVSEDAYARETNHCGQFNFYYKLNEHVDSIQRAIKAGKYQEAGKLAGYTFSGEIDIPSVEDGNAIDLKIGRTGCRMQGFILGDIFLGLIGIVSSIVTLIASILLSPILYCAGSKYFGTLSFDLDAAKWFADSIRQLTFALIFPLGMLYAKYTTDSYDITKGEVTRLLESIIACCNRIQEAAGPSMQQDGLVPPIQCLDYR